LLKREFFQIEQGLVTKRGLPVKTIMTGRQPGSSTEKIVSSASLPIIQLRTAGPRAGQVCPYALHWAELLDAQIHPIPGDLEDLPSQIVENSHLLIYEEPEQSWFKTWLCGPPACGVVSRWPVSVLVARQPRWPLKKILLITRGRRLDYTAVTWVAHLAPLVKPDITALVVQPYLATADSQALYGQGIDAWLTSNTPLGQQLRRIENAQEMVAGHIDLQFRGGSPGYQIRHAVVETQPDLVVIACEPADWCERRILGELVGPLLRQADRPVLVAKSNF
jgi:nucleotide-binding universal stress UspA family protein